MTPEEQAMADLFTPGETYHHKYFGQLTFKEPRKLHGTWWLIFENPAGESMLLPQYIPKHFPELVTART